MNKKIKTFALVAAVAAIGGYGVYTNQQADVMSDLVLANVEALAKIEDPDEGGGAKVGDPCYKGAYNSLLPEATKCAKPCTPERCGGAIDKCY